MLATIWTVIIVLSPHPGIYEMHYIKVDSEESCKAMEHELEEDALLVGCFEREEEQPVKI